MLWMRGLTSAERKLVLAAQRGQRLRCEGAQVIRADVIRDLLLGRHGAVDPRGVQLTGALVAGALDLEGVRTSSGLNLTDCRLLHPMIARDADLPWLELIGCDVRALSADKIRVTGSVFLRQCVISAETGRRAVRFAGARIGGNLECDGSSITSVSGPAFHAEDARIEGNLFLRDGFSGTADTSLGTVTLNGAFVGGSLNLFNVTLANSSGPVLSANRLRVEGELWLGGDSSIQGKSWRAVIDLAGASLGGVRWSRFEIKNFEAGGALVCLDHVTTDYLSISSNVLCEADVDYDCASGDLLIYGLMYGTLATEGADWLSWLHWIQSHTRVYTAQSYSQLAGVEHASGNDVAVRRILIAQQDDRRFRGEFDSRWSRLRHRTWGLLAGYGYRVSRTVVATLTVLILAGLLGLWAGHTSIRDGRYVAGHTSRAEYPFTPCSTFEQIGLGIDRGLPLAATGVRERCDLDTISRRGQAFAMAIWLLQVAVWILATLVIVGYSGLIRRTD
ncbi:hypothetical protein ABZX92_11060 [Lentzea sp. NPDC006480]|uniref:hypothetical protein n=1 Tax=Lentzea sp. NPDC006480 TaxID=3157176 RepID=UPI0033A41DA5